MKLQAITNDPSRSQTDMADIESLVSIHGNNLDWSLIEEYFKLFNMGDVYKKMKGK